MNFSRFEMKIIRRSRGQNVLAAICYRAATRMPDPKTGRVFDYRNRHGVLGTWIQAPVDSTSWVFNREELWRAIHLKEARKDAQLAREFQLSIPHELPPRAQQKLVQTWVEKELVSRGMIADIALHAPPSHGDPRNFHAHVLCPLRSIARDGSLSNKVRDWNGKQTLLHLRTSWNRECESFLRKYGFLRRADNQGQQSLGRYVANSAKLASRLSRIIDQVEEL